MQLTIEKGWSIFIAGISGIVDIMQLNWKRALFYNQENGKLSLVSQAQRT